MTKKPPLPSGIGPGLTSQEAASRLRQYGPNMLRMPRGYRSFHIMANIVREPMFLLLAVACILYFILGAYTEGYWMIGAMLLISGISFFQEVKSTKAVQALKEYTAPRATVIRDGREQPAHARELVPGDIIRLSEGDRVPADAKVLQPNDFTANEAAITGESLPVEKKAEELVYQGSTVNSGQCIALVTATGNHTTLGKLGRSISVYEMSDTLLQRQMKHLVRRLSLFGLTGFLVIWIINYRHEPDLVRSLLFALTLAMSVIPEELPVAFSSFMALGAYRLARQGIISRNPQMIENMGAINALCLDKTGTITENRMQVKAVYAGLHGPLQDFNAISPGVAGRVVYFGTLASEKNPFDQMEVAIQEAYRASSPRHVQLPDIAQEYPLEGQPPMMTHVYRQSGEWLAAAKGAAERVIRVCRLPETTAGKLDEAASLLAGQGYRVLGVASAVHKGPNLPATQDEFAWQFEGLLALYDPPRKNVQSTLATLYSAGIEVWLLTGDHPATSITIAGQVGLNNNGRFLTGREVMEMDDTALREQVREVRVFARMFPEAKVKVINALKKAGEIVAMTGDGVNDGPALKTANVGIAMGNKGTEIARLAADLVLTDDDIGKIVTGVQEGRRIFSNLLKAIRYILSIHIPIILTASVPVILGWRFPNIFTPLHIIFLELIMGPTCSIFFEREPVEGDIMRLPPRENSKRLFSTRDISITIAQGLTIAAAVLLLFYYTMEQGHSIEYTRAVTFITLILANFFLTFINRSFTTGILDTIRFRNNLTPVIIVATAGFLAALLYIPLMRELFGLEQPGNGMLAICLLTAFASTGWFEAYKLLSARGHAHLPVY